MGAIFYIMCLQHWVDDFISELVLCSLLLAFSVMSVICCDNYHYRYVVISCLIAAGSLSLLFLQHN